jgi:hypothetical protein
MMMALNASRGTKDPRFGDQDGSFTTTTEAPSPFGQMMGGGNLLAHLGGLFSGMGG